MSLPASSDAIWSDIISGKKQIQFEFLAVKMFLGRAQLQIKNDPALLSGLTKELHSLFEQNVHLPSVQKDLQKLN